MRLFLILLCGLAAYSVKADTIDHYMSIYNAIPKMELKADPEAQTWARSARNVLAITNETIAETLLQANETAKARGKGQALFCIKPGATLNANTMGDIIVKAYQEISSRQSDKNAMTVSQVAWVGISKTYPCQQQPHNTQKPLFNQDAFTGIQHVQNP